MAQTGKKQAEILSLSLPADLETPISAMMKLTGTGAWSFLLESVEDGAVRGRYSVIGMAPDMIWRVRGGKVEVGRPSGRFRAVAGEPLALLRQFIDASKLEVPSHLPPLAAGIFGYMGYDMVRHYEYLPNLNEDALGLPDALFLRPSLLAIFDSVADSVHLVAVIRPDGKTSMAAARKQAQTKLNRMAKDLSRALVMKQRKPTARKAVKPASNVSPAVYRKMVEKARNYIWAGDIFQATISQRFSAPLKAHPFSFYRALRHINPSPYLFYFNFGDFVLAGSSPEILVRCVGGKVMLSPIAGTIARTGSEAGDEKAGRHLLGDPKEQAEHLMLLDLGRNDVGRVSKIGSVKVVRQFALQKTSHLIHIVSDVEGQLDKSHDALDALMAGFPAGTVSGAPKVRAMEIIDEIEPVKRGIYAGSVGYFAANGDMDSCICLRTAIIKDDTIYVQAGGGIVADSVPSREYQESVNKARALVRAAEEASRFPLPQPA